MLARRLATHVRLSASAAHSSYHVPLAFTSVCSNRVVAHAHDDWHSLRLVGHTQRPFSTDGRSWFNFKWLQSRDQWPQSLHPVFRWAHNITGKFPPVRHLMLHYIIEFYEKYKKYEWGFYGIVFLGFLYYGYDQWHARKPAVAANTLMGAFEKGFVPVLNATADAGADVPRDDLQQTLQTLLRPAAIKTYAVVVGAHGTGKVNRRSRCIVFLGARRNSSHHLVVCYFSTFRASSLQSTAVRKAVRDAPKNGPHGVVYCSVDNVRKFSLKLAVDVRFRSATFDLEEAIRRLAMSEQNNSALPDLSAEPRATWDVLDPALMDAAMEFK